MSKLFERPHTSPHRRQPNGTEMAQYAADLLLDLRNIAKAQDYKTLQGLLELSYYEAFALANPITVPPGEKERLDDLTIQANKHIKQVVTA
jgi:hypothetical protein